MTQYIIVLALVVVSGITAFGAFGGTNRAQVFAIANEIAGNHNTAKDSMQLAQNYAKYASDSASYSRNMGNYSLRTGGTGSTPPLVCTSPNNSDSILTISSFGGMNL